MAADPPPATPSRPRPGGVAGHHPRRVALPVLVAPSTGSEFNALRPRLVPIACWRLEDVRFEFALSWVRPESEREFTLLAELWRATGKPPMSVFGHADPVGDDEFNKRLSGRRAKAIYAVLVRDVDAWEALYAHPAADDNWQPTAVSAMLTTLGHPPGPAGVRAFQSQNGMTPDGAAGPQTRRVLYAAYMDAICHDADGTPFSVTAEDFLAGGADPGGKGDYQGCSEFNPILVFSAEETQGFQSPARRDERNAQNAPNRRVLVFLFRPGSRVTPAQWPCPRVDEPTGACRAQFWPDGDARRGPTDERREYETSHDTFACAFYDALAHRSPCEAMRRSLRVRLMDPSKNPIPRAPYQLTVLATGEVRDGTADGDAVLAEDELLAAGRLRVEYGDPRLGQTPVALSYRVTLYMELDPGALDEPGARRRLHNLGYTQTDFLADLLRAFQCDYGLPITGELDGETRGALVAAADRGRSRAEIAAGDLG